jgi:hypothetical protein
MEFVRGTLCGLATAALSSIAFAQFPPPPFVRITGFLSTPSNTCTDPSASLDVIADGTSAHSDTYEIYVNGALHFRWAEGEDMSWVNGNSLPYGLTSDAGSGSYVANTTIVGRITSYNRSNPSGPVFIAGEPVYSSEISWNCTTGEQIGAIMNQDLRPRTVPLPAPWGLTVALAVFAFLCLRTTNAQKKTGS